MTVVMEHCDDKGHGSLWLQWSWGIVTSGVMEHCEEMDHVAL